MSRKSYQKENRFSIPLTSLSPTSDSDDEEQPYYSNFRHSSFPKRLKYILKRRIRFFRKFYIQFWIILIVFVAILVVLGKSLSGNGVKQSEVSEDETDPFTAMNLSEELEKIPISDRVISSNVDSPFQVGCREPDINQPRANAALVVLARNSEIEGVITSMSSLERHFNQWFNYPWVFLNDEPFTEEFKSAVSKFTSSEVEFGLIDSKDWNFNPSIDSHYFHEYIESQGDRGILYGKMESYHKMCRFYSGFFYKHELVKKRDWYWRVEPDVDFFCDITYDPFVEMEKSGKKYGFTVMIAELYYTVPNLFRYTRAFINQRGVQLGTAWNLFIKDYKFLSGSNQAKYDGFETEGAILSEIENNMNVKKLLEIPNLKNGHFDNMDPKVLKKLAQDSKKKRKLKEDVINREEYNLCHFWSNFEIARTDLFNSPEYESYFQYLEKSEGFFKERWGDAPIHSLAVGMFLNISEIHYFRDIGYKHSTLGHCPANSPKNQLEYKPSPNYYLKDAKGLKKDDYWLKPGKSTKNGVGCRCRCPSGHKEIENSGGSCIKQWSGMIKDDYGPINIVDLDKLEAKVESDIDNYLATGGKLGMRQAKLDE